MPNLPAKYSDPDVMDFEPLFSSEAQTCFKPGDRVYDAQTLREGVYVGRYRLFGDVAVVSLDGDRDATEMSFADLKQVYR